MQKTQLAVVKFRDAVPAGSLVRELRAKDGWEILAEDDTVRLKHPVKGVVLVNVSNTVAMVPVGGEANRSGLPTPAPEAPKAIELPGLARVDEDKSLLQQVKDVIAGDKEHQEKKGKKK